MSKKRKEKQPKKISFTKYETTHIRMKRFFALVFDWYITSMIVSLPVTFYLRNGSYLKSEMFDLTHYPFTIGLLLGLFGVMIGFIYHVIIPSFVWQGQTLGKKICKVKVVDEYGKDVSFGTLFLREMIFATFLEGGIIISAAYLRKLLPLFGFQSLYNPLMYISYALTIISIIYAYFNPLSQSFHDKLAKTVVVNK